MNAVFITVWFGPLPEFFELFRATCYHNKYFDWIVYTDQKNVKSKNNVKIKHITKDQFISLAHKKLGSTVTTLDEDPRKVTDFKPFYGMMFANDIKQYKFHGHCDIDMMLGDMRLVIQLCKVYDIISSRRESSSGHMMLFRKNQDRDTALLKNKYLCKYHNKALHDNSFCRFDESGFTNFIKRYCNDTDDTLFAQWGICNYTRMEVLERIPPGWYDDKPRHDAGNGFSDYIWGDPSAYWIWKDGKLFSPGGHEITYLHYLTCTENVVITGNKVNYTQINICFSDSENMHIDFR